MDENGYVGHITGQSSVTGTWPIYDWPISVPKLSPGQSVQSVLVSVRLPNQGLKYS